LSRPFRPGKWIIISALTSLRLSEPQDLQAIKTLSHSRSDLFPLNSNLRKILYPLEGVSGP
jgi:hypothetical protein